MTPLRKCCRRITSALAAGHEDPEVAAPRATAGLPHRGHLGDGLRGEGHRGEARGLRWPSSAKGAREESGRRAAWNARENIADEIAAASLTSFYPRSNRWRPLASPAQRGSWQERDAIDLSVLVRHQRRHRVSRPVWCDSPQGSRPACCVTMPLRDQVAADGLAPRSSPTRSRSVRTRRSMSTCPRSPTMQTWLSR
jgi:hypothetical protein